MKVIKNLSWKRDDVVNLLKHENSVGIELGVAAGGFSERMVNSGKFKYFFGVDRYEGVHTTEEYKTALVRVGLFKNYSLFKMTFAEALSLFEDNSLDFIYVDGYAHTGQLGGKTIFDWYTKLKIGGVMAGDDYDIDTWPLVVEAVNYFAEKTGSDLYLTGTETTDDYSLYPSWAIIKQNDKEIKVNRKQVFVGELQEKKYQYTQPVLACIRKYFVWPLKKYLRRFF